MRYSRGGQTQFGRQSAGAPGLTSRAAPTRTRSRSSGRISAGTGPKPAFRSARTDRSFDGRPRPQCSRKERTFLFEGTCRSRAAGTSRASRSGHGPIPCRSAPRSAATTSGDFAGSEGAVAGSRLPASPRGCRGGIAPPRFLTATVLPVPSFAGLRQCGMNSGADGGSVPTASERSVTVTCARWTVAYCISCSRAHPSRRRAVGTR